MSDRDHSRDVIEDALNEAGMTAATDMQSGESVDSQAGTITDDLSDNIPTEDLGMVSDLELITEDEAESDRLENHYQLSPEELRLYRRTATLTALGVGLIFALVFGLFIAFCDFIWFR